MYCRASSSSRRRCDRPVRSSRRIPIRKGLLAALPDLDRTACASWTAIPGTVPEPWQPAARAARFAPRCRRGRRDALHRRRRRPHERSASVMCAACHRQIVACVLRLEFSRRPLNEPRCSRCNDHRPALPGCARGRRFLVAPSAATLKAVDGISFSDRTRQARWAWSANPAAASRPTGAAGAGPAAGDLRRPCAVRGRAPCRPGRIRRLGARRGRGTCSLSSRITLGSLDRRLTDRPPRSMEPLDHS